MSTTYKSISELSSLAVDISLNDKILLSRYPIDPDNGDKDNSNLVSYNATVSKLVNALSNAMSEALSNYIARGFGDLAYTNLAQLNLASKVDVGAQLSSIYAKDGCVISSISQDKNKDVMQIGEFDLKALSNSILGDGLKAELSKRKLNYGITLENTSNTGVVVAKLHTEEDSSLVIDPKSIISIDPAENSFGDDIATVKYGTGEVAQIKNNFKFSACMPSFDAAAIAQCGDAIAKVNDITLYNNLSVTDVAKTGDVIASVNGKNIKNGIDVQQTAITGSCIAKINSKSIYNGITITPAPNSSTDKLVCTINGQKIYNCANVVDKTSTYAGDAIAEVNGVTLHNGISVYTDAGNNQTYINGVAVKGGIQLGTCMPIATTGDKVATIQTASGTTTLYSGVSSSAIDDLRAEITALKKKHDEDIARLEQLIANCLKLSVSEEQSVIGPVIFNETITGTITNAKHADSADWS